MSEHRLIARQCQHCDGRIEFDPGLFAEKETRHAVNCPHCHMETVLFRAVPVREPPLLRREPSVPTSPLNSSAPHYVKWLCQFCNGQIEFDANQLQPDESRAVECPHCQGTITLSDRANPTTEHRTADRLNPAAHESEVVPLATVVSPTTFSEFIGQNRTKARLEITIAAARSRKEPLGHILFVGSPGLGRATLARLIAKAMGANVKSTSGPAVEKEGDLAGLLTNLEEGEVLFIDEVHRLRNGIEQYLSPALEDFKLDITIDQGPNARSVRLKLPKFTLIGSTTSKERVSRNFLSCFQIIERLDAYSNDDLTAIVCRFAKLLKIPLDEKVAEHIARSSDGTPLDLLRRLQHIEVFAHVQASSEKIETKMVADALKLLVPIAQRCEPAEARAGIPSEVRREVWRRDGGKCVKCGSREKLEYDHIIPVAQGGSNTARNIELLCEVCNRKKSDSIQ